MYITNMTHFLDEKGNIPTSMPREARELASFLALVVDFTTKNLPISLTTTDVMCFEKGCGGMIKTALHKKPEEIHWYCPECENEGVISGWQKTKWDNWVDNK